MTRIYLWAKFKILMVKITISLEAWANLDKLLTQEVQEVEWSLIINWEFQIEKRKENKEKMQQSNPETKILVEQPRLYIKIV